MALPKLDREAYREQMRSEFERVLQEVADAVDTAPQGRVIRDSEEKTRDALDRFRQIAYERAIQLKVNAAEAAFPPSAQRGHRKEEAAQGKTTHQCADDQRTS
jgi:hypothetical protein